jgi:hypothetical protein
MGFPIWRQHTQAPHRRKRPCRRSDRRRGIWRASARVVVAGDGEGGDNGGAGRAKDGARAKSGAQRGWRLFKVFCKLQEQREWQILQPRGPAAPGTVHGATPEALSTQEQKLRRRQSTKDFFRTWFARRAGRGRELLTERQ